MGVVYEPDAQNEDEEEEQVSLQEDTSTADVVINHSAAANIAPPPSVGSSTINYNDPTCFGKLFIGGLSWESTEDTIYSHFNHFGPVANVALMKDKYTGQPRGFGFVTFQNSADLEKVLTETHKIDGRNVDVKKAVPKDKAPSTSMADVRPVATSDYNSDSSDIKKIFVGGLPGSVGDVEFKEYFQTFGIIEDAIVMIDRNTKRSRGFGFVTFQSIEAVEKVLQKTHLLHGKNVEIKRAEPKTSGGARHSSGGPSVAAVPYGYAPSQSYGYGYGGYAPPPQAAYGYGGYPPPPQAYGYGGYNQPGPPRPPPQGYYGGYGGGYGDAAGYGGPPSNYGQNEQYQHDDDDAQRSRPNSRYKPY